MKATLTFKMPDILDQLPQCTPTCANAQSEQDEECNCGAKVLRLFAESKIDYEYLRVEFDGEAKTTKVV